MARPKSTPSSRSSDNGETGGRENLPNPVWFKPVMFGFMLIGLAWIIVFYLTNSSLPIYELGAGNIAVGFGLIIIGFFMTTRWR
jgi:hypothetical protein